jgi:hypothetical protein
MCRPWADTQVRPWSVVQLILIDTAAALFVSFVS